MKSIQLSLLLLMFCLEAQAQVSLMPPPPSFNAGSHRAGWAYFGKFEDGDWLEHYFERVDDSSAPLSAGDELIVSSPVNIRQGPIREVDGKWTNQTAVGSAKAGDHFIVQDVKEVYPGFIWVAIQPTARDTESARLDTPDASDPAQPEDTSLSDQEAAQQVTGCFNSLSVNGKPVTPNMMRDCAGVWITPRVLVRCALGEDCPTLPDTYEGGLANDAMLKQMGLTRDSPIELTETNIKALIPPLPANGDLEACKNAASDEAFGSCVSSRMAEPRYGKLLQCFKLSSESARLSCFADQTQDPNFTVLIGCIGSGQPSAEKILECTPNQSIKSRSAEIRRCVEGASNSQMAARCILPEKTGVSDCISSGTDDAFACLARVSPEAARSQAAFSCLTADKSDQEAVACISAQVGGDASRITSCLNQNDRMGAATCLLGDKPEVRAFQRVQRCINEGHDTAYILANCTEGVVDGKTGQTLACISNASGDNAKLSSCAASAVLPPDAARLVGCATSSQGPTSFALCAAAPAMNEEWRIAAECAVSSGGEPLSFTGCTASRLTVRELTKCLSGRIGKDCFGPNNTIVKAYANAFKDITQGLGENNELVKAVHSLQDLSGGPNSVINNPKQLLGGPNSMVNNPGQIWGGDSSVFNQAAGGPNSEFRKFLRRFF